MRGHIILRHEDTQDCPDVREGRAQACPGHQRTHDTTRREAWMRRRAQAAERQAAALEDIRDMLRVLFGERDRFGPG